MNVLFSLYQNFECNSANHVDGIARVLCTLGCDCIVAVPAEPTRADLMGAVPYKTATFQQVLGGQVLFDNGGRPDVVHFWTPREVNRSFFDRLRSSHRFAAIIHMEDNEELIARSQLRGGFDEYAGGLRMEGFPAHLSHPRFWKTFLEQADGFTLIVESLKDIVPPNKPAELTWPSTDERSFYPRPFDPALRRNLALIPGTRFWPITETYIRPIFGKCAAFTLRSRC